METKIGKNKITVTISATGRDLVEALNNLRLKLKKASEPESWMMDKKERWTK